MTTRMVHPAHGATHAYGESDVAKHKALGWAVEGEAAPPASAVAYWQRAAEELSQLAPKRKPGRQPKAR